MNQTITVNSNHYPPAGSRLARVFSDTWVITRRSLHHWQRQPGTMIVNWLFPVMIALMFGLMFGGALEVPQGGSYFEYLMPGMFAMTVFFGLESTLVSVFTDAGKGITDRFRSMPVSAVSVVLGRCLADLLNSLIGLVVMFAAGWLLGWRWHGSLLEAAAGLGLLILLRFALLWVGIYLGLAAKNPDSVTAVQILVWPVSFLSNIFVDPATMPAWLGTIAEWNPLSATVTAMRALFGNPGWQGEHWVTQNALLVAVVWSVLITAVFLPMAARTFRRLNHS